MGKKLTSIGSEVTKDVMNIMKIRAQDCVQSGGYLLKIFFWELIG